MGQTSTKSSKKSSKKLSKPDCKKTKVKAKDKNSDRSVVVFLPHPFIHPDSKSPEHTHERRVVDLLTKFARREGCLCVDYFTLGATVEVPGMTMNAPSFIDFTRQMLEDFPDFHFEYQLLGETSPGVVVAIIQACGTHSRGAYYTILHPEPLPASNTKCKNDPEYCTCVFKGLKVVHSSFFPVFKDTQNHGPDGFYRQIKDNQQENL